MINCKVCGDPYKAITMTHIRKHGMKRDEYDAYDAVETVSVDEIKEIVNELDTENIELSKDQPIEPCETDMDKVDPITIDTTEKKNYIFEGAAIIKDPNRPIAEFLEEFKISEKELRNLVRNYKDGSPIPVSQQMANSISVAAQDAAALAHNSNVETESLNIAESLVTDYNFKVITVRGKPRKIWVLEKGV